MQTVHLDSWQAFRDLVDAYSAIRPTYWRGQAHPGWPMASSFERRILALNGGATEGPSAIYPYDGRLAAIFKLDEQIVATRQHLEDSFKRGALGLLRSVTSGPRLD